MPDPLGLRIRGAVIDGRLDLRHLTAVIPIELVDCYLRAGADLREAQLRSVGLLNCRIDRSVDADGAHIGGHLNATGTTIVEQFGPALSGEGIRVDGGVILRDGFVATGTGDRGSIRLDDAHIGGLFNAAGACISNSSGPAISADRLRLDNSMILRGLRATGSGERGAVRLLAASISGQVDASSAVISNDGGPALIADQLRVDISLVLRDLAASGAGAWGTVRLHDVYVGSSLHASGATIRNDSGPALRADRLKVEGNAVLGERFAATGAGSLGAVRLPDARIGGRLDASSATIRNESGPALHFDRLKVEGDLILRYNFTAIGAGPLCAVRLRDAHVGGLIIDLKSIKDPADQLGSLDVDGLVYVGLPDGPTVAEGISTLANRTPRYAAQPYRQLAAVTQAAGHDGDTRKILIAQRRDQLKRNVISSRPERVWAKVTGLTLGYGYQPWRALTGLVAIVAAAIALTILAGGHHGGLVHAAGTARPGTPCTTLEQIGVGVDLGLPLIKSTAKDNCATSATQAKTVITITGWVLQLFAWALATLFVAGFTGAVRKT